MTSSKYVTAAIKEFQQKPDLDRLTVANRVASQVLQELKPLLEVAETVSAEASAYLARCRHFFNARADIPFKKADLKQLQNLRAEGDVLKTQCVKLSKIFHAAQPNIDRSLILTEIVSDTIEKMPTPDKKKPYVIFNNVTAPAVSNRYSSCMHWVNTAAEYKDDLEANMKTIKKHKLSIKG